MNRDGLGRLLQGMFVLSGLAGLVYQSIWSHYLGLTLGHAAYAQTLVLAIFMGGMAIGAWAVSRYGNGWRRLILAYAVVEAVIGVLGLVFHPVFIAHVEWSQSLVYPALADDWAVRVWQWGTAALLILPQSVLLGMTFPLMSGGYLRIAPDQDGRVLGGLYFSNSIGAAAGALLATFLLMPVWGMPGTVAFAGGLNLLVAVLAWWASRALPTIAPMAPPAVGVAPVTAAASRDRRGAVLATVLLSATFISGAASFVYEIGWVRMLNQALGTTIHSFELMLAAFILGLAFGGGYVRRRSADIADPVAWAGWAQVLMGLAALASLPVFANSFGWVAALMSVVPRDDAGYTLFMAGSAVIALVVMFPAAFFAGMTLPLFTMALLRAGHGERVIGRIYAANTLGAILGVMLAVHVLIPAIGVRLSVTLAAVVDVLLGLLLLSRFVRVRRPSALVAAGLALALVAGYSLLFGRPDPLMQASGVYRTGDPRLDAAGTVSYLRDGKTATVAVYAQGEWATIATNGKPDASLAISVATESTADEATMILAGSLPLLIHPNPRRVAVIGWGSGLSTHTVLGSPVPERVESIEIERAMVDAAALLGDRVVRAYRDPRSTIHIDDARTYFSAGGRQFDAIVSEPSNPWVSGVAGLFTQEFYRFVRQHLAEGGVLVQWLQSYEIDDRLLATMVAALLSEFPFVDAYVTNSSDLIFVAAASPLPAPDFKRLHHPGLIEELHRIGIDGIAEIELRRLAGPEVLRTLVRMTGVGPHSDYYPVVALNAPRTRFANAQADLLLGLHGSGLPVLDLLEGRHLPGRADGITPIAYSSPSRSHHLAIQVVDALTSGDAAGALAARDRSLSEWLRILRGLSRAPVAESEQALWLEAVVEAARHSIGLLPSDDLVDAWLDPNWIAADQQGPAVQAVLAAFAAAARRDAPAMHREGLVALAQLGPTSPASESMLAIALLGAAATGGSEAVAEIEQGPGRAVPPGWRYPGLREFVRAWRGRQLADAPVPNQQRSGQSR